MKHAAIRLIIRRPSTRSVVVYIGVLVPPHLLVCARLRGAPSVATSFRPSQARGAATLPRCSLRYSRPRFHELAAFGEQVGPPVRRLNLVRIHVRQGFFGDLARKVRALRGEVAEARPEAMRDGTDLVL